MWCNLHRGILEAFADAAALCDPTGALLASLSVYNPNVEHDAEARAQRAEGKRRRTRLRRCAAVAGKVCKHAPCGKPVSPVKLGPIPDYCSPVCKRRAKWARWYEAHREERIAQRRAA